MKLVELFKHVPIESNIVVIKNDKFYSNTEYFIGPDFGPDSYAQLYSREDFISNFGNDDIGDVLPNMYGYDDCLLEIHIKKE